MLELRRLVSLLGYKFTNGELLEQSLTHRSATNETGSEHYHHNERLEFLGDAVIDLVVGEQLMQRLPNAREGILSKLRAMVVSETSLARAAQRIDLGAYVRLGKGEELTGGRDKTSILADAFEAVVGAVYLDGGAQAADMFVRQHLGPLIDDAVTGGLDRDHKTRLQELVQAKVRQVPRYAVVAQRGPDHAKEFEVAVSLGSRELARSTGSSKKEAEQEAARLAIDVLERR